MDIRAFEIVLTIMSGLGILRFILTLNLGICNELRIIQKFSIIKCMIFIIVIQTDVLELTLPDVNLMKESVIALEFFQLLLIAYWNYKTYGFSR